MVEQIFFLNNQFLEGPSTSTICNNFYQCQYQYQYQWGNLEIFLYTQQNFTVDVICSKVSFCL